MLWKQPPLRQYIAILRSSSTKQRASLLLVILFAFQLRQRLVKFKAAVLTTDPKRAPPIEGFVPVSDQIYVREPEPTTEGTIVPTDHPNAVVIYGWGDGLPRHLVKYAEGFRALFPNAKQVLVLSPINKALLTKNERRGDGMMPVIDAMFSEKPSSDFKILLHVMSNTGGINYIATLDAYNRRYGEAMPNRLVCLDSAPGSSDLTFENLERWSRAMALRTAKLFPLPFVATQVLMCMMLVLNGCVQRILLRESSATWGLKIGQSEKYVRMDTRYLYLYSKEDDLVGYKDVEKHAAEARQRGWQAETEMFNGSPHVMHMRQFPDQYWKAISTSWDKAIGLTKT
ncbi:hypothetical protein V2G26_001983 [Clonostachys chloroleuca]|uniref:DUF829-domain-containing protein n=1 Tax=Clonostachys chloroleuca TaxID=1926264 RepID=A0AA35VA92_9HYPO|nr:unnamed protein product [Clonostachys chloroleuca]